jgi:hypothetical protein
MAGTRIAFEATYASGTGRNQYRYTVVYDLSGVTSVRDIRTPFGLILDSMTRLPQSVVADINASIAQVEGLLSATSAINGTANFVNATSVSVTFVSPLANTNYRVHLSPSDFVPVRVISKTVTGFTIEAGVTFTGSVGYDVFV